MSTTTDERLDSIVVLTTESDLTRNLLNYDDTINTFSNIKAHHKTF